ncbi:MAG: response regulator [Gemmatimonadota bacterium]|nr:response regulator [Gemmatimonadota bacterium]
MKRDPINILLVEDNDAHAELVMRSLEEHSVANRIFRVADGEAALDFLYHRSAYADEGTSPRPHIILLDLKLPRVSGLDVLEVVKQDAKLSTIPVVILTTSQAESDVSRAYDSRANSYISKPMGFEEFARLMDELGFFWLKWNQYPWPDHTTGKRGPDTRAEAGS